MRGIAELCLKYHEDRDIPVLIEGETGTGKEVIARLIHNGADADSAGPFVDINCAALSPTLIEAELFGYEPGAYTGASAKGGKGKIDAAAGGTLFLDEISEMPLELQAKLLRVIQEKEFYRVGGTKKTKVDIRVVSASNRDLAVLVREGHFRQDLWYRLNVGHIIIPPLRERKDEILPLAEHFLSVFAEKKKKKFRAIGAGAKGLLLNYRWPGNVRELQNAIEWAVFMFDGTELLEEHINLTASAADVPAAYVLGEGEFSVPEDSFPLEEHMDKIILKALAHNQGNKVLTARYLKLSRHALYTRLKKIKQEQR